MHFFGHATYRDKKKRTVLINPSCPPLLLAETSVSYLGNSEIPKCRDRKVDEVEDSGFTDSVIMRHILGLIYNCFSLWGFDRNDCVTGRAERGRSSVTTRRWKSRRRNGSKNSKSKLCGSNSSSRITMTKEMMQNITSNAFLVNSLFFLT